MSMSLGEKDPNMIQMFFCLATLGWLWHAWEAYLQMTLYGSILALFAGVSFLYFSRIARQYKEFTWLFGWNDDPISHALVRMFFYASIFVGPITRHVSLAISPDIFTGRKYYVVVIIVSGLVGLAMSIYMRSELTKTR